MVNYGPRTNLAFKLQDAEKLFSGPGRAGRGFGLKASAPPFRRGLESKIENVVGENLPSSRPEEIRRGVRRLPYQGQANRFWILDFRFVSSR